VEQAAEAALPGAEGVTASTPACAPFLRPRAAPAWAGGDRAMEDRWVARGLPILFHHWAALRGFHQPLPRRLDAQYVTEREAERNRGLAEGVYRLPPSQDPKDLVRRGHMIMPAFFVDTESRKGLSAEAWKEMSPEERIKHLRFVSNLKKLNRMCKKKSCRFEGLEKLCQMSTPGRHTHATSWDVKSAFNLIEMLPEHQKYMTLDLGPSVSGPRFVMCAAMPFGYTNSPYVFTRLMRKPVAAMRAAGIPTMIWLDDGLNLWESAEQGRERLPEVEAILEHYLGPGARHPSKGEGWPEPVTRLSKHLGTTVDLDKGLFMTPEPTLGNISKQAGDILRYQARNSRWAGALRIAQFAGLCISTYKSNLQARFRCRDLHDFLVKCDVYHKGYGVRGKLNRRAIRALEYWRDLKDDPPSKKIWRKPTTKVWATDASKRGHGGLDHAVPLDRVKIGEEMGEATMGLWSPTEQEMTICALELRAFRIKLEVSGHTAAGCGLLLLEDNMGVVYILKSFVTRSEEMRADLEMVMDLLAKFDIDLRVRYIESALNPSDYFSREADNVADAAGGVCCFGAGRI